MKTEKEIVEMILKVSTEIKINDHSTLYKIESKGFICALAWVLEK